MPLHYAALAIAALALWSIPSVSFSQGNSGKARLTICHISPGNPEDQRTLTIVENAWRAHESHGDFLGPCEGSAGRRDEAYGADAKREKKSRQKQKGRSEQRSGSARDDAEYETGAGGRAGEDRDIDGADRSAERERRHAERRDRERRVRDEADPRIQDSQAAGATESEAAGNAEAGEAEAGTDEAPAAEGRAGRKASAGGRNQRGMQPAGETDAAPEAEPGFFRGMQQFFGFGEDAAKQPDEGAAD